MNILFIGDIMMKSQQSYLSKNYMKQHGTILNIKVVNEGYREFFRNFQLHIRKFFFQKRELE